MKIIEETKSTLVVVAHDVDEALWLNNRNDDGRGGREDRGAFSRSTS
jgi:ABC-type proline/glycine betaine transport system ATPase subunit